MTLALTRVVEACLECSSQICKLCRRVAPLSADKAECDGCRKCTSVCDNGEKVGGASAETDHVSAKEAAAGSKGKNASQAESGAEEAAAEPSTTKTYFATRHSGFKYIGWHRQTQKWSVQITGVRVRYRKVISR